MMLGWRFVPEDEHAKLIRQQPIKKTGRNHALGKKDRPRLAMVDLGWRPVRARVRGSMDAQRRKEGEPIPGELGCCENP